MDFPVTTEEKAKGVVVALVITCSSESLAILRELSSQSDNQITFLAGPPQRDEPIAQIKTFSTETVAVLLDLSEIPGNRFKFPRLRVMRSYADGIPIQSPVDEKSSSPQSQHTPVHHRNQSFRSFDRDYGPKTIRRDRRVQFPRSALAHY